MPGDPECGKRVKFDQFFGKVPVWYQRADQCTNKYTFKKYSGMSDLYAQLQVYTLNTCYVKPPRKKVLSR